MALSWRPDNPSSYRNDDMATLHSPLSKTAGSKASELSPRAGVRSLLGGRKMSSPSAESHSQFHPADFTQLRLTAEKMMQDQACVQTELKILKTKLQKSEEQIQILESKLQKANNEKTMLKVTQQEDLKLVNGLESKLFMTNTVCDQLTETLQHMEIQLQEVERSKICLQENLAERLQLSEEEKLQIDELSLRRSTDEAAISQWKSRHEELKEALKAKEEALDFEVAKSRQLAAKKDEVEQQLGAAKQTSEEDKATFVFLHEKFLMETGKCMERAEAERQSKEKALHDLRELNAELKSTHLSLQHQLQDATKQITVLEQHLENSTSTHLSLQQQLQDATKHVMELEQLLEISKKDAAANLIDAQEEIKEVKQMTEEKVKEKERLDAEIHNLKEKNEKNSTELAVMARNMLEAKDQFELQLQAKQAQYTKHLDELLQQTNQNSTELAVMARNMLEAKDQFELQLKAKQAQYTKHLDELLQQTNQNSTELAVMARNMLEANYQFELQLEANQAQYTKHLDELLQQTNQILAELDAVQSDKLEAKRLFELQIEERQAEFSNHLQEISQQHEEELNDLKRQFEVEKLEAVATEVKVVQSTTEEALQEKQRHEEVIRGLQKQNSKILAELDAVQSDKLEAKRLFELQIEERQAKFLNRLQEISQQHEEEVNDLRRQFEVEKLEAVATEVKAVQSTTEEALQEKQKLEEVIRGLQKQNSKICTQLALVEQTMVDSKRQAEVELEAKQANLTKLLQEISQHNHEEITDMRRKYEAEKREAISTEVKAAQQVTEEALKEKQRLEDVIQDLQKQNVQICTQLALVEQSMVDSKRQAELELEAKQADLTKHLHEISQRNHQEITDLRRKYEAEKREAISTEVKAAQQVTEEALKEKQKLEDVIQDLQKKNVQICTQLALAEQTMVDSKRQAELELEAKQANLTKHLQEISQRNHEEISDMRRKYEAEKREAVSTEVKAAQQGTEEALKEKERLENVIQDLQKQNVQICTQVALVEQSMVDNKRQAELELEAKQANLTKRLQEISQRNHQEITGMKRKYEAEKREAVSTEVKAAQQVTKEALKEKQRLEDVIQDLQKKIQVTQFSQHKVAVNYDGRKTRARKERHTVIEQQAQPEVRSNRGKGHARKKARLTEDIYLQEASNCPPVAALGKFVPVDAFGIADDPYNF